MNSKEALEKMLVDLIFYESYFADGGYYDNKDQFDIVKKDLDLLEEYRKIEEEFGIDLITIFNIYNKLNTQKSIYTKLCSEIKEHHLYGCYFVIDFNEMAFRELDYDSDCLYFKHYGKTWALTREELENDK